MRFNLIFTGCLFARQLAAQAVDSLSFPAAWAGNWTRQLEVYNGQGLVQSVAMEIEIHK